MKLSGLVVLGIALLLAVGAAFLINEWLDRQQEQVLDREAELEAKQKSLQEEMDRLAEEQARLESERGKAPETVSILVAAKDLPADTKIDRKAVRVLQVPQSDKPERAFTRVDQVLDDFVKKDISEGEPILPDLLRDPQSSFAARIPSNMRSITIDIDEASGQLKLIKRDDLVDVLIISGDSRDSVLLNRLQNIKVLAVGQKFDESQVDQVTSGASSVTLEVTSSQAELLSRAMVVENNKIRLILRNQDERDLENKEVVVDSPALSNLIKDNYRAITIDVNEASGQLSLIEAGSRVDVVVTPLNIQYSEKILEGGATELVPVDYGISGQSIIFDDIKVLSVGQNLNDNQSLASSQVAWNDDRSVTLEIHRDIVAEFARLASTKSNNIQLLLRSEKDNSILEVAENRVTAEKRPTIEQKPKNLLTLIRGTERCKTPPGQNCP